jgi:hypothetical protein
MYNLLKDYDEDLEERVKKYLEKTDFFYKSDEKNDTNES